MLNLLANPDTLYAIVTVVGGLVGYWIRHKQGDTTAGLPAEIADIVKTLLDQHKQRQARELFLNLSKTVPPVESPPPTPK